MLAHEERSKIAREAALRRYAKETPEQKDERIRKAKGRNKGRHHTEESKQKLREARAKQHQVFDEMARKHMSEAQKRYWESLSKKEREIKIKRFIEAPLKKTKDTKIELEVERQLKELHLCYEKQKYCYNKKVKRGFYIDFYLPDYDIMIECNGNYWHSQKHRKERDRLLNDLVLNSKKKIHKNLKLITLWEDDIKTNPNLVKESLNGILGNLIPLF